MTLSVNDYDDDDDDDNALNNTLTTNYDSQVS